VTNARLLIGIVLGSVILSSMIASSQLGIAFVDSEPDEDEQSELIGPLILVVYLLFVIRYFVANEGRKYTVSAFSTSVILATVACSIYEVQVGGWWWNDAYVMEDALIASIEPIIFLFLFNEFVGIPLRMRGGTGNSGKSHPTSLVRLGIIASFPLVVMTPPYAFGLIILLPTLAIFFVSYWASTDTPLSLKGN
tara:strand:+ start:191 stop:772 length:582 start_codon:yes stop_codon:yes gene_type:complete